MFISEKNILMLKYHFTLIVRNHKTDI